MRTFNNFLGLFFLIGFMGLNPSKATHIMGGDITYQWISGNSYLVNVSLYRDCAGLALPASADIAVYSSSCQDSFVVTIPLISNASIQASCNSLLSSCNGGSALGYERGIYQDTITLPASCSDWHFIYANCCRNATITNLVNGGAYGALFSARLDNLHQPFNNSPVFLADPVLLLSTGTYYQINNGAFDPDGDSIVLSLAPAMDGSVFSPSQQIQLSYNAPLSYLNPVTSSPVLALDPVTGTVTVTPQTAEVDIVVYRLDEYRNGILIGSATRDIQVNIQPGGNLLPSLTGMNGSANFMSQVCFTDSIQFTIGSTDGNPGDSTFISWHAFTGSNANGSNYSFAVTGTNMDSATFTFYPDSTMISPMPYYLYVSVKDNSCPHFGMQTYCYVIYVNSCSQDVWPGDANSDLMVNLIDLLPIGLAYNDTGSVRNGASLLWAAQPCTDWSQSFFNGVNHKHADCNGDGIVNAADTTALALNYGLSHPAKQPLVPVTTSTIADMYLVASPDTVSANLTVNVKVCLGTASVPVDSIYGIAFRINFNPALVDSASGNVSFSNSWMGTTGTDLIPIYRNFISSGYSDIAMVRTDHNNISGDSIIAIFSIVIVDNIAGKMGLPFTLSDVYAITYSGAQLNFNLIGDTVLVSVSTGVNDPAGLSEFIQIYPVPANQYLDIRSQSVPITAVHLVDLTGREIHVNGKSQGEMIRLNLEGIAGGTYMLEVQTPSGKLTKRINVSGQ